MTNVQIISGDLFDSKETLICHQVNCVTTKAAHLAKSMFARFPYSDIYSKRTEPDKPGTIIIRGDGVKERKICAMLAQYYPGASKYKDSTLDGTKARKQYFKRCLFEISKIPNIESIAFPYQIGCGAAGGDFIGAYLPMITSFADYVKKQQNTIVKIYKLDTV